MERLTKRIGNSIVYSELNSNNSDGCYEMMNNCLHKLADYEDAEEQGLLLRLPCKVGDTVWYIDEDDDYPLEFIITKIDVEENDYLRYHAREKDNCGKIGFIKDDIGKTLFLTKEEAEQALAEMEGE